jgi:hypothetical protein
MRTGGQRLRPEWAHDRPMTVGQHPAHGNGYLIRLVGVEGIAPANKFRIWREVSLANFDNVVAFLPQAAGNGPVATNGDVHDRHADT